MFKMTFEIENLDDEALRLLGKAALNAPHFNRTGDSLTMELWDRRVGPGLDETAEAQALVMRETLLDLLPYATSNDPIPGPAQVVTDEQQ